jgi:hypothetical protein
VVQVALSIEGTVRDSEEHRAEKSECSELHFGNFNGVRNKREANERKREERSPGALQLRKL